MTSCATGSTINHRSRTASALSVIVTALIVLMVALSASTSTIQARGDGDPIPPKPGGNGGGGGGGGGGPAYNPDNPPIKVSCANPELKIALLIDRSDSVIKDGNGQTPTYFKDSVKLILDEIHARFNQNLQLDVIVYAFGTKAVLQSERTATGQLITDASTVENLNKVKSVIDRIHFRNGELFDKNKPNTIGFQSASNDSYDLARGYNAGTENAIGDYGNTNWHDPFINVLKLASDAYNDPSNNIDVAFMLSDGLPNVYNGGGDYLWTPGVDRGPNADFNDYTNADDLYRPYEKWDNLYRVQQPVNALRDGKALKQFSSRPPVSVQGIIIRPPNPKHTAAQVAADVKEATDVSERVFGDGNFAYATNFSFSLKQQIAKIVANIVADTGCTPSNSGTPALTLSSSATELNPVEGDVGDTVTFTVDNAGDVLVKDTKLCIGIFNSETKKCSTTPMNLGSLQVDELKKALHVFNVEMGGQGYSVPVTAYGDADAGGGNTVVVSNTITITVTPQRIDLPA